MCRFIRSLREGDFRLYVHVCDELCSWFHLMNHTKYARWLPIHVRDMVQLPAKHSQVYTEFLNGNCCAEVTSLVQAQWQEPVPRAVQQETPGSWRCSRTL